MSVKLNTALGFAAKAGKIRGGDFTAEKLIKSGKTELIIIDSECSEATQSKWEQLCEHHAVKLLKLKSPGGCMGKPDNKIFAVNDSDFCNMILQAVSEQENSNNDDINN